MSKLFYIKPVASTRMMESNFNTKLIQKLKRTHYIETHRVKSIIQFEDEEAVIIDDKAAIVKFTLQICLESIDLLVSFESAQERDDYLKYLLNAVEEN